MGRFYFIVSQPNRLPDNKEIIWGLCQIAFLETVLDVLCVEKDKWTQCVILTHNNKWHWHSIGALECYQLLHANAAS